MVLMWFWDPWVSIPGMLHGAAQHKKMNRKGNNVLYREVSVDRSTATETRTLR